MLAGFQIVTDTSLREKTNRAKIASNEPNPSTRQSRPGTKPLILGLLTEAAGRAWWAAPWAGVSQTLPSGSPSASATVGSEGRTPGLRGTATAQKQNGGQ